MPDPRFAHCQARVRAGDHDRFIASLFAPAVHRDALYALYAFNLEIARVREVVREPLAGEIRLQWWSDMLLGAAGGEAQSNPVAAALTEVIGRYHLPTEPLTELIAAHRFDLYDQPMATLAELEAYGRASSLVPLAAKIVLRGCEANVGALARHAGLAYAIAGLLRAFPIHVARGQLFVPLELLARHGCSAEDVVNRRTTPPLRAALAELRRHAREHLAQARGLWSTAFRAVLPALLPVALVGPTLARMERRGYDPFVPFELAPLRRQWLIWRAVRQPDRIFLVSPREVSPPAS
jgi:15-cis-phytoene synthase